MNYGDRQTQLMRLGDNAQAQMGWVNGLGQQSCTGDSINWYWHQQQYTPWSITYTNVTSPDVHHLPGNVKPGTSAPCGVPLAEKKGEGGDWALNGNQASTDIDKVTCLKCLRELAKAK